MLQSALTETGTELFLFFLSDLLGKRVYSSEGRYLGRFEDIAVPIDQKYPAIEAFVLSKGSERACYAVGGIDLRALATHRSVKIDEGRLVSFEPTERHFFVRGVLYDRQIVDVNGAKVERVNDVSIHWRDGRAFLTHVDVGFTGLVRRLGFEQGFERLARAVRKRPKDKLIDWKFVQPLPETFPSPIHVSLRQEEFKQLHAGEVADILEDLDRQERITLVQSMGAENAADALEETELSVQTSIIRDLDTELAADILEEMEPAVAADVIDNLPADTQEEILAAMEDEDRAQIEILVHAKEDSAASLMTVDFLSAPASSTVAEAFSLLRQYAHDVESITYIYCTDEELHLLGIVSLRDLLLADASTPLSEIMNQRLVTLKLDDDWDAVAGQFLKLRFKALPVVDEDNRLLGIVTFLHSFDELLPFYSRLRG